VKKVFRFLVLVVSMLAFFVVHGQAAKEQKKAVNLPKAKEFRIERSMPKEAVACLECHKQESPGLFVDWARSRHASANITCLDCHQAEPTDPDVSQEHFKQYQRTDNPWGKAEYRVPVAAVVTPKDCSRCHPDEATQYSKSKHANTMEIIWKIDPWLNKGMNSEIERATGCYYCHGTVLKMKDGKLDPMTWPNVGVGRVNLDGSKGSCTSCHTRHRLAVMDARKPEACGQCHLGPDHPQIEIYKESKHGDIYDAFGHEYNWDAAPGTWTPGVDFRGPTCASCHMSGAGKVLTSHDVTERLSWESQAPLTVRPSDFKPFPAPTDWKVERQKMQEICLQCHGKTWVEDHYVKMDKVMEEYNEVYFKPAKKKLDELYAKKLLDNTKFFDEKLEVEYYELWHHEGRRARMGAQMMAPDYTWWHGFYECKKRFVNFMEEADELIKHNKKAYVAKDFPAATGSTQKPPEVFGKEKK
jgi:hydroxylamine dehydrogenase